MKRRFINVLTLAGLLALGGTMASCGSPAEGEKPVDPNPEDDNKPGGEEEKPTTPTPGAKDYTFEAEYTDLEGKVGGGISGSQSGVNMIGDFPNASNGLAVGFLHKQGISVDYVINSDKATTATMSISLGNELTSMELKPGLYDIEVNGTKIKYNKITVKGVGQMGTTFEWKTISPKINLVEGENTIKFVTGTNEYCNGGSGAPIFDCLKLNTDATLSWTPLEDNI